VKEINLNLYTGTPTKGWGASVYEAGLAAQPPAQCSNGETGRQLFSRGKKRISFCEIFKCLKQKLVSAV